MKNTLLLLLCCAFQVNISAQTFAYNFPGDFDGEPFAFVKKSDGRFLIAGTSGGPFDRYFFHRSTNGYIMDWDAEEGLINSKQLEIYGRTTLHDVVELINGNFAASGWEIPCSEPNKALVYVKCFDLTGDLLWTKYTDTITANAFSVHLTPIKLAVRPGDGKIAQVFNAGTSGTVNLLDQNNGEILYKSVMGGINDLAVNPKNNRLVVISGSIIRQINPITGNVISQLGVLPQWWASYSNVLVDAAGTVIAISDAHSAVTKWPLNSSTTTTFPVINISNGVQWVTHGSGFAEYRSTSNGDNIRFFDADFQLQSVTTLPNLTNFQTRKMYLDDNTIFLAGFEEHGPRANSSGSGLDEASSNLLIRRFSYDGSPQETEEPDIAVTGISIEVPPVFTEYPDGMAWQIIGGKYALTLRNNGNILINEVQILSSEIGILEYDSTCRWQHKYHFSRHLQNINLAPGEETVVTIDSLNIPYASNSDTHPWKLCFWTAAPNQRRDADYSNDYTCLKFYDAVPTEEPTKTNTGLRIHPNPASKLIRIIMPEVNTNPGTYRILSYTGMVVQQGNIPTGTNEFPVVVEDIPAGVYFVETGGIFGRFVKL